MNIKQIQLIRGYVAVYKDEEGDPVSEPVIGIAVVAQPGESDRMRMFSIDENGVSFCEDNDNFQFFALEESE
jgi:hypothetical protein